MIAGRKPWNKLSKHNNNIMKSLGFVSIEDLDATQLAR